MTSPLRRTIFTLVAGTIGLCLPITADAATIQLQSIDNGWYTNGGTHSPTNINTYTGELSGALYNSFYNFNTSALVGSVVTALSITFYGGNGQYNTPDAFETVQIWDVTTTPGLGSSIAVYNDLMSGVLYGQTNVFGVYGQAMPQFTVSLSSASFADASADGFFSLGAHIPTLSNPSQEALWSSSGLVPAAFLTVQYEAAPAPTSVSVPDAGATFALLALGLAGCGVSRRFLVKPRGATN